MHDSRERDRASRSWPVTPAEEPGQRTNNGWSGRPRPAHGESMLDALKNMTGGKGKLAQQQTDDLEMLIASAKEERSAISSMLTALTTRTAKLTPLTKQ